MKVALFFLGLFPLILLTGCTESEPQVLLGMVRQPPPNVSSVALPAVSHGGGDYVMTSDPGRFLIVYFGYTSCPDICPSTLADLRRAISQLEYGSDKVDVAFVTVDPERDTSERLTTYIQAFFPDTGVALRTLDAGLLRSSAEAFGAAYDMSQDDEGEPVVAHSAFLYAVDEQGRILVQWPFGMSSDDINNDLAYLFENAQ